MILLAGRKFNTRKNLPNINSLAYGIGLTRIRLIKTYTGRPYTLSLKLMPFAYIDGLDFMITRRYMVNKSLIKMKLRYLKPHVKFGTYRGLRMKQGLPRNGQRTHSNAGTSRRFKSKSYKYF